MLPVETAGALAGPAPADPLPGCAGMETVTGFAIGATLDIGAGAGTGAGGAGACIAAYCACQYKTMPSKMTLNSQLLLHHGELLMGWPPPGIHEGPEMLPFAPPACMTCE